MRRDERVLVAGVVKEILELAKPYFVRTQWVHDGKPGDRGKSRPLMGWIFKRPTGGGHFTSSSRKLRGANLTNDSYCGITETGLATDVWVGLQESYWEGLSLEDALAVLADLKQVVRRKRVRR